MDGYTLLRIIGRGSFGIVHLYRCLSDSRNVVIKQISVEQMSEQEKQASHNEVRVLSMLHHPNIIEYYTSFVENNALAIVMEYADGGTLSSYLKERQGQLLSQEEALHLFSQLLLALHHIHSNNILHRDLSTNNIFLSGNRSVLKIGDFGISKVLVSKSKAISVVGTPCYLSPELCEGRPYNQKSDIWALGCVLYEMLTLKKAFEAPTLAGLVLKIMHGAYKPIEASFYEKCIHNLLQSLLHQEPSMRPSVEMMMSHPALLTSLYSLYVNLGRIPST